MLVCVSHIDFSQLQSMLNQKLGARTGEKLYLTEFEAYLQENSKHYLTEEERTMRY